MEKRPYLRRPDQSMAESPSPLVRHLAEALTERGQTMFTFGQNAGIDRSLIWRVSVGHIANPGLRTTAAILVELGKKEAYEILVESARRESVIASSEDIFPIDAKVAKGDFSGQLRKYRLRRGLSPRELEMMANLAKDSVLKIEKGKAAPRLNKLSTIVVALGLNSKQTFNLLKKAAEDDSLRRTFGGAELVLFRPKKAQG